MRKFLFENIWLLSSGTQRAAEFNFHPRTNLIVGRNHTGKSTIIKLLFQTLGATPQGKLDRWDESATTAVAFSVDGNRYVALRHMERRALFDSSLSLLAVHTNHESWSEQFAAITGFNLIVSNKKSEPVLADPQCFFVPFYINQDGSWLANWNTFVGLQQYQSPVKSILDYFTGVKPPKFYELSSQRSGAQKVIDELRQEKRLLDRARDRFEKSFEVSGVKLEPENFADDIQELSREVTQLNSRQEALREKLVREQEAISGSEIQIGLALAALEAFDKDVAFLGASRPERLICPTCGAEHDEQFLEFIDYAEGGRALRATVHRLRTDAERLRAQHQRTASELRTLDENYERISTLLNVRRGDLLFRDVVSGLGAERAIEVFRDEAQELISKAAKVQVDLEALDRKLRELSDSKRAKAILRKFRDDYASHCVALHVAPPKANVRLTSRPEMSGSGGPRSILAYYAALWDSCYGEFGSFSVPLVIDAPNQQGQDDVNLPAVLKFIASDLPRAAQVILGTELKIDHKFDHEITLEAQYELLSSSAFERVRDFLEPLVRRAYGVQGSDIIDL